MDDHLNTIQMMDFVDSYATSDSPPDDEPFTPIKDKMEKLSIQKEPYKRSNPPSQLMIPDDSHRNISPIDKGFVSPSSIFGRTPTSPKIMDFKRRPSADIAKRQQYSVGADYFRRPSLQSLPVRKDSIQIPTRHHRHQMERTSPRLHHVPIRSSNSVYGATPPTSKNNSPTPGFRPLESPESAGLRTPNTFFSSAWSTNSSVMSPLDEDSNNKYASSMDGYYSMSPIDPIDIIARAKTTYTQEKSYMQFLMHQASVMFSTYAPNAMASALKLWEEAFMVSKKRKNYLNMATTMNNVACVHRKRRNFDKAMSSCLYAWRMANQSYEVATKMSKERIDSNGHSPSTKSPLGFNSFITFLIKRNEANTTSPSKESTPQNLPFAESTRQRKKSLTPTNGSITEENLTLPFFTKEDVYIPIIIIYMEIALNMGNVCLSSSKYEKAMKCYQLCLDLTVRALNLWPLPEDLLFAFDKSTIQKMSMKAKLSFLHEFVFDMRIKALTHISMCFHKVIDSASRIKYRQRALAVLYIYNKTAFREKTLPISGALFGTWASFDFYEAKYRDALLLNAKAESEYRKAGYIDGISITHINHAAYLTGGQRAKNAVLRANPKNMKMNSGWIDNLPRLAADEANEASQNQLGRAAHILQEQIRKLDQTRRTEYLNTAKLNLSSVYILSGEYEEAARAMLSCSIDWNSHFSKYNSTSYMTQSPGALVEEDRTGPWSHVLFNMCQILLSHAYIGRTRTLDEQVGKIQYILEQVTQDSDHISPSALSTETQVLEVNTFYEQEHIYKTLKICLYTFQNIHTQYGLSDLESIWYSLRTKIALGVSCCFIHSVNQGIFDEKNWQEEGKWWITESTLDTLLDLDKRVVSVDEFFEFVLKHHSPRIWMMGMDFGNALTVMLRFMTTTHDQKYASMHSFLPHHQEHMLKVIGSKMHRLLLY